MAFGEVVTAEPFWRSRHHRAWLPRLLTSRVPSLSRFCEYCVTRVAAAYSVVSKTLRKSRRRRFG